MRRARLFLLLSTFLALYSLVGSAQITDPKINRGAELDSLRKQEEEGQDTLIITAKYIRYTTLGLLEDSTQTVPLDTTLTNFNNYSLIRQPKKPTMDLGNNGLAYRELLFEPTKTIGFDAGFHALDLYLLRQDSIRYYRAKSPYTELYYVNGGTVEQIFKVTHSQNINPNWNFGANYFRNGSPGFYKNQKADHTNIALFTWYEAPNNRYNLLASALFNTLRAGENGSVIKDSIFTSAEALRRDAEIVRFSANGDNMPQQIWRKRSFFVKQFYNIGKIDSSSNAPTSAQRISHTITYTSSRFKFFRKEEDTYSALPRPVADTLTSTNDSTMVNDLQNEFMYSFYLRGKSLSFIKNELKLDVGIRNNLYKYEQMGYKTSFQNTSILANISYRFSDKITIKGNLQQILAGRNFGDYLYVARTNFLLSRSVGRITLGAYIQNKSPEQLYERINYQHHTWNLNFDNTKVSNLSFAYENTKFALLANAEYFLLSNYLFFAETALPKQIAPQQAGSINLLKLTVQKELKFGKFNLQNFVVYQKTDSRGTLRIPELYVWNSFYFTNDFFKVLHASIGIDIRYHSPFANPSYSLNVSQFYNGSNKEYRSIPISDVWIKATLKRTNLFLKYDYANQGLFPGDKGYYTVNRYPMPDAQIKFGISWKFYN